MSSLMIGLFVNVAASIVFFLAQPYLFSLEDPSYRWMISVGLIIVGMGAAYLLRFSGTKQRPGGGAVLSNNEFARGADVEIENSDLSGQSAGKLLSDNTVGGETTIRIRDSKL